MALSTQHSAPKQEGRDERFSRLESLGKAHALTLVSYEVTKSYPRDEIFGLVSQIRRASSSIPANIAEGCGRRGNAELHRFLQMAMGSANELQYHFLLSRDLGYLNSETHNRMELQVQEVKRMLASLIRKVDSERI